jgi:hypothetical protein
VDAQMFGGVDGISTGRATDQDVLTDYVGKNRGADFGTAIVYKEMKKKRKKTN